MEKQLEKLKKQLHLCMAFIGGCFGAYAILHFGHFASAVTVNFIEVFTGAAQGNWQKSLLRFGAVGVYFLTLFLAAWLPGRVKKDLRLWAILTDVIAMPVLCILPESLYELGVYLCVFTMGFQWAIFAGKRGYPCSTIFSTNNLRQFIDAWVQVSIYHDTSHAPRMRIYGATLLFFHLGVIAVCLLWRPCGRWSILCGFLPAMLALVWQRQDLRIRRSMGEEM